MNIETIADALGTALQSASPPIRYLPYLGDQVNPPVALVAFNEVEYHMAFGDYSTSLNTLTYLVHLILARGSDRTALQQLGDYLSTDLGEQPESSSESIVTALTRDITLDGLVVGLKVERAGPPLSLTVGGVVYLSCSLSVIVYA